MNSSVDGQDSIINTTNTIQDCTRSGQQVRQQGRSRRRGRGRRY